MLLSLGVYWTAWGWQFALGIILSIYVHEMGHVFALHRYGFKATAPMFIPGIGALVRLQQPVINPHEDAEIGLAGPIYGLGAALFSAGIWLATSEPVFAGIAAVGAWINLFNLLPFVPLDGGRGFRAMSRVQKLLSALACAGGWLVTHDGLLILLGIFGFARTLGDKKDTQGEWKPTIIYVFLVVALSALAMLRAHTGLPT
jgi:Zn-dependent protease